MNTKEKAVKGILSFLQSDQQFLFLNGTYQNEKHPLALAAVLYQYPGPATILFRVNAQRNADIFLSPIGIRRSPKPGTPIRVEEHNLYVDTINPRSWNSSPSRIDVAIVYPTDSLNADKGGECVEDLVRRQANKIMLVTWTDNKDFGWVDQFNPVRVTYDAEEKRPDYHARMREIELKTSQKEVIKGLPDYAKTVPSEYLVKIHCRTCGSSRWARLNKPYPGKTALRNAEMGIYTATCLKCRTEEYDNYNWYGR